MKRRFNKALELSTELRAFLVLLVVIVMRARRAIPTLRPTQLLIPATLMQITVLMIAAFFPHNFIVIFAVGNFIVVGIVLIPVLTLQPKSNIHLGGDVNIK